MSEREPEPKPTGTGPRRARSQFLAVAAGALELYLRENETYLVASGGSALGRVVLASDALFVTVAPDLLVLEWYLKDSRPPWGFSSELGRRGWLRRHSLLAEKAYAYFKLDLVLWSQPGARRFAWHHDERTLPWAADHDAFPRLAADAKLDWGAAWQSDSWKTVGEQLARLKQVAAAHRSLSPSSPSRCATRSTRASSTISRSVGWRAAPRRSASATSTCCRCCASAGTRSCSSTHATPWRPQTS